MKSSSPIEFDGDFLEIVPVGKYQVTIIRATDGLPVLSRSVEAATRIDCKSWLKGPYVVIVKGESGIKTLKIAL